MRRRIPAVLIATLAIAASAVPTRGTTASDGATTAAAGDASIVEVPVHFDIVNTNGSALPCPSDGRRYTVRGHLAGPRSEFSSGVARSGLVTVLLTGWDEGEWTWRFKSVPGYDYPAEMAKLGHTSLSIDMLGYGSSGRPQGHLVCFGSQADILHQIVQQLRAKTYAVDDASLAPVPFSTVLVSAHDIAPIAAIVAAYSWPGEIDGLSTQIIAHQGFKPGILELFARRNVGCGLGGQNSDDPRDDPDDLFDDPSHGGGYIFFGPRDDEFRRVLFHPTRMHPSVADEVIRLRNRNPCGQLLSNVSGFRMNLTRMGEIDVPVLLVFPRADLDPVIDRGGQEAEAANYSGSDDVTTVWMDSGHFMELETCAPDFRALYANWVHDRWDVGKRVVAPTVAADGCITEIRLKEDT